MLITDPLPEGSRLLVYMPFGSFLYGTSTAESDHDYKGVFIAPERDVMLGRAPKSIHSSTGPKDGKNSPDDVDVEWIELRQFIKLACEGQTVAIDMLHAKPDRWQTFNQEWMSLHNMRHEFHTRGLKAFVGYCRRQAAKYGVKGSRLSAVREVIAFLEAADRDEGPHPMPLCSYRHRLPTNEHVHWEDREDDKHFLVVCGRKLQDTLCAAQALVPLRKFAQNYGARAEAAARNEGVDWKAVSHALRAAYELRAIYTHGDIRFPLPEARYLRDVKQGKLDFLTEVGPELEASVAVVEYLSSVSQLPEQVDRSRWDDWTYDTMRAFYRRT